MYPKTSPKPLPQLQAPLKIFLPRPGVPQCRCRSEIPEELHKQTVLDPTIDLTGLEEARELAFSTGIYFAYCNSFPEIYFRTAKVKDLKHAIQWKLYLHVQTISIV